MNRILLVEDDVSVAVSLQDYLQREGYAVVASHNLQDAEAKGTNFDLLILDWMLPDGQGVDFLRALRRQNKKLPVVFLTAKADLIDKVLGLESGANDYLTKPFEPRELLARIRVHLRKTDEPVEVLQSDRVTMDLRVREIRFQGVKIEATRKEFDLLALLLTYPGKVFSREELLNKVWGFENFPTTRTVDTHVLQLRQKLSEDVIQTVRGIGYRMRTGEKLTAN